MSDSSIQSRYEVVKKEPTDMWEHMDVLKAHSAQCASVVEFGVYDCTSTWALLAGLPKKLTSYDIARRPEVDEVEQAASDSSTQFKFVLASSTEVELDPVDLLFIDSKHTYEHLKAELALHANKIGRYIILHDTTTFGHVDENYSGRGLWPAVEEFLADHPEWTIRQRLTNCHGLTVLERVKQE